MVEKVDEHFLRTIADAVPSLVARWDRDLLCTFANKAYVDWFGRPLDQIVGCHMQGLLGEQTFEMNRPHIQAVLAGDEQRFERVVVRADGREANACVTYIPHWSDEGNVIGFFVLVTDVSALRLADKCVQDSEARYRLLADHSSDMVFQLDRDMVRRYVSPACLEILGYKPQELIGIQPVSQVHPEDTSRVAAVFHSLLDGSVDRNSVTNRIRHKSGHWVWVEVELRSVIEPVTGLRSGIIGAMRDISSRKAIEEQLAEATHKLESLTRQDVLTGLANRRGFDEALSREFAQARRDKSCFSIVMIDVDKFKLYNDRYGHLAGDDCLRQVSGRIVASVRQPRDVAARFGGEEFALLLPATDEARASLIAERIRSAIERLALKHPGSPAGVVTISAGIASISGIAADGGSELLLKSADLALYEAKAAGRNRLARASLTDELFAGRRLGTKGH